MKALIVMFAAVFLAELGDKTQLATVLFASNGRHNPLTVFLVAGGALLASTALAVLLGSMAERWLTMIPLKLIAGLGFIAIGVWTVWSHYAESAPTAG